MAASGEVKVDSTKLNGASLNLTVGDPNSDLVLGQPDFMTNTANLGGLSGHSLSSPMTPSSDGQNLFVADGSNHRILIWNQIPSVSGTAADINLGQINFQVLSSALNLKKFLLPWGLEIGGQQMWIADNGNNRVLRIPIP